MIVERLQERLTHFVIYPEKIYNRHQLTVELIASKNSKSLSACLSCNVPECLLWLDCSLRSRFKVFLHPRQGMKQKDGSSRNAQLEVSQQDFTD